MKRNFIVMPIYQCKELTREAVESCLAQDIGNIQILCVLDKATDGVGEYLRSMYPKVQTIAMPGCGVSRAWNTALNHILEDHDGALVVNSDVKLRPDAYRLLKADGGDFVTCVGTSSGAKFPGGEPSGRKRPHPDFSCFYISRHCWLVVGEFDARMRIYTSDLDYHIRMHQSDIEAYCLDLPFLHYASGTLKTVDTEDRDRILAQAEKDRNTFEQKWGVAAGSPGYYEFFKTIPAPAASAESAVPGNPPASESGYLPQPD